MSADAAFTAFDKEVNRLVASFERNLADLKRPDYSEAKLREDFLNPFFRALGWDMENRAGLVQTKREVEVESRTQIQGRQKRADYLFRTEGRDRFVCEAKKPAEELHARYAFQAKRYAWNKGLALAVLTDFEEMKIFIVGGKPHSDEPDVGLWKSWHFKQYPLLAQELWDLLARDKVAAGSIDQLLESLPKAPAGKGKAKQGWLIKPDRARSLDVDFLNLLDEARRELASDLLRHNDRADLLEGTRLNEAIQRILDRILFLRICEDRDIDTGIRLDSIVGTWRRNFDKEEGKRAHQKPLELREEPPAYFGAVGIRAPKDSLWRAIVRHFRALDRRPPTHVPYFNGNLFKPHFCEELVVSDEWLAGFVGDLSDEESPYLFNYIPVEILGTIYERFLGKIVRPHGKGAVIEEKPEVRKAGGVYYTPRYIVDYIVEQTVGKLLEEQKPEAALKLRVLDPACGSGSFLLCAFERVCEHWEEWLMRHPAERKKDWCWLDPASKAVHLTVALKRQILTSNIYGVDIDAAAVEVTQLSLYLKMLENENRTTLQRQRELLPEDDDPLLPPLENNIKCFNSLIGSDFSMIPEDLVRVNAGDWSVQFPAIMKAGGFDAVIGNPPWLMAGYHLPQEISYFHDAYQSATGKFDLYYCFVEKGISLVRADGSFGMIVPNKLLHTKAAASLRNLLKEHRGLRELLDFCDAQLFEGATNYSAILLVSGTRREGFTYKRVTQAIHCDEAVQVKFETLPDAEPWSFAGGDLAALFEKICRLSVPLESLTSRFGTGAQTGSDKILTLAREDRASFESRLLRPILRGRDVKRFHVAADSKLAIFPYEKDGGEFAILTEARLKKYPRAYRHLAVHRAKLDSRVWFGQTAAQLSGAWFGYVYLDKREAIEKPHILTPSLSDRANFALGTGDLFLTGTAGVTSVIPRPEISENIKYLLALLNSRLLALYALKHSPPFSGGFFKFSAPYLKKLPIRRIDFKAAADRAAHDKLVALVDKTLALMPKLRAAKSEAERKTLQNAVTATDQQIDELVYDLYDLTAQERELVEASQPSANASAPAKARREAKPEKQAELL